MSKAVGRNSIGVHHRGTTTSDHGPYAAFGVENGELKRRTGRAIKLLDVCFLLCEVATKRRRPDLRIRLLGNGFRVECQVQAYHGRSTVSRDALALGQG